MDLYEKAKADGILLASEIVRIVDDIDVTKMCDEFRKATDEAIQRESERLKELIKEIRVI